MQSFVMLIYQHNSQPDSQLELPSSTTELNSKCPLTYQSTIAANTQLLEDNRKFTMIIINLLIPITLTGRSEKKPVR